MAYVKTVWETGDVITADKLNNMEGGIEAANLAFTGLAWEPSAEVVPGLINPHEITLDGVTYADLNEISANGTRVCIVIPADPDTFANPRRGYYFTMEGPFYDAGGYISDYLETLFCGGTALTDTVTLYTGESA